jgi:hypothetical protein
MFSFKHQRQFSVRIYCKKFLVDFFLNKNKFSLSLTLKFKNTSAVEFVTEVQLIFSRVNLYWKYGNGSLKTNVRELALNYMGLPSGIETPFNYSFVCSAARFRAFNPAVPKGFKQVVEVYINGFQVSLV